MSATSTIRVLGVDTALRSSGAAVVEARGNTLVAIEYGIIKTTAKYPVSQCLKRIYQALTELIARTKPDAVAIEGIFYCRNVRTAVVLGQARGAVIAACAVADLPVYEYSPRRVKQAIVGYGGAGKEQVRSMVMSIMNLHSTPAQDAADALAIAACHLHSSTQHKALAPKAI